MPDSHGCNIATTPVLFGSRACFLHIIHVSISKGPASVSTSVAAAAAAEKGLSDAQMHWGSTTDQSHFLLEQWLDVLWKNLAKKGSMCKMTVMPRRKNPTKYLPCTTICAKLTSLETDPQSFALLALDARCVRTWTWLKEQPQGAARCRWSYWDFLECPRSLALGSMSLRICGSW